jgi:twitching motility protein PilJ
VVKGARLAQDAGVALEEIESVSSNLAELIQSISNAARQQASSAGHISNTMNVIQEITSQTSSGTSATARSIGNLSDMTSSLRTSVAGFTLPGDVKASLNTQGGDVNLGQSSEELQIELEAELATASVDDLLAESLRDDAEADLNAKS